MNNKGFAVSGVLYIVLLLFISIMTMLLFTLQNRKSLLDVIKSDTYDLLNQTTYYTYDNGYEFYFNPEINKACSEEAYQANLARYKEQNSTDSPTGLKTGCLKWHVFNDINTNSSVTAILDHNTTALVAYNSTGSNAEMKEINTALITDTTTWNSSLNARLISADEIAEIVKNNDFDSNLTNYTDWFYLDTLNQTAIEENGAGASKYAWLFNYLKEATNNGANYDDNNQYIGSSTNYLYGYWTSSKANGSNTNIWYVENTGKLLNDMASTGSAFGLRPVIEIDKNHLRTNKCPYEEGYVWEFDYTGAAQSFDVSCSGTYKIELWGASGSYVGVDNLPTSHIGKGAYTSGQILLNDGDKLYVYVGGSSNATDYSVEQATFNGGGAAIAPANHGGYYGTSGGGATDIRIDNGAWDNADSLKSRIMVAAGGGGGSSEVRDGSAITVHSTRGGSGGGLSGYDSSGLYGSGVISSAYLAKGATQIAGGQIGSYTAAHSTSPSPGTFGKGGTVTATSAYAQGGGGGGYYGGGSGSHHASRGMSGGSGGSSYISGHTGCIAIESKDSLDRRKGADGTTICALNTTDPVCSRHYSDYVFEETVMIDGEGYSWTTSKAATADGMPTHDGLGTMTGNIGVGYAKITYLGN